MPTNASPRLPASSATSRRQVPASSLELSQGTRFLDVWFDNIFTDFSVRGRIKDAQAKATRAHDAVAARTSECVRRIAEVRARLAAIDAERAAALG